MRYNAQYDETGNLTAIGTGSGGVEITKDEYDRLLQEIIEKAALVDKVYGGEMDISEVREDWREDIERRVNERIAAEGEAAQQDISAEEALDIILGGAQA